MNKQTLAAMEEISRKLTLEDKRTRYFVDDPDYEGKGTPPQIGRSAAMRKFSSRGISTKAIARFYGVPYQTAYLAVRVKSRTVAELNDMVKRDDDRSTILEHEDYTTMTKAQLLRISEIRCRQGEPAYERVVKAIDELDRRFPGWV